MVLASQFAYVIARYVYSLALRSVGMVVPHDKMSRIQYKKSVHALDEIFMSCNVPGAYNARNSPKRTLPANASGSTTLLTLCVMTFLK